MLRYNLRLPFSYSKSFSSNLLRADHVPSSCVAGTPLNLKVRKSGDEPIALEDSEYPDWLWNVLDTEGNDKKLKANDIMKWRKRQLNKANCEKIKAKNFLAKKK